MMTVRRLQRTGTWVAALTGLLLAAQPVSNALHFVIVDHGTVTCGGALGHGHDHGPDDDHARNPAFSVQQKSEVLAACGYLETILRTEDGDRGGLIPSQGAALPCRADGSLSLDGAAHCADLLTLAPKHSPPAA